MDLLGVVKEMLLSVRDSAVSSPWLVLAVPTGSAFAMFLDGMTSLWILDVAVSAYYNALYDYSGIQIADPTFLGVVLLLMSPPVVFTRKGFSTL